MYVYACMCVCMLYIYIYIVCVCDCLLFLSAFMYSIHIYIERERYRERETERERETCSCVCFVCVRIIYTCVQYVNIFKCVVYVICLFAFCKFMLQSVATTNIRTCLKINNFSLLTRKVIFFSLKMRQFHPRVSQIVRMPKWTVLLWIWWPKIHFNNEAFQCFRHESVMAGAATFSQRTFTRMTINIMMFGGKTLSWRTMGEAQINDV